MRLIKINSWTLGAPYHYEACLFGAVSLGFKTHCSGISLLRVCASVITHYRGAVQLLEGLVHRVIAQLFALSGQLGLGVFVRESVLVRLGVIRRRFVFMRFSGEDDDGIRGDVVWTRSYQRRGHRSDCGLGACAGAWQIWERGW